MKRRLTTERPVHCYIKQCYVKNILFRIINIATYRTSQARLSISASLSNTAEVESLACQVESLVA